MSWIIMLIAILIVIVMMNSMCSIPEHTILDPDKQASHDRWRKAMASSAPAKLCVVKSRQLGGPACEVPTLDANGKDQGYLMWSSHYISQEAQRIRDQYPGVFTKETLEQPEKREQFGNLLTRAVNTSPTQDMVITIIKNPKVGWGLGGTWDARTCYTTLEALGWQPDGSNTDADRRAAEFRRWMQARNQVREHEAALYLRDMFGEEDVPLFIEYTHVPAANDFEAKAQIVTLSPAAAKGLLNVILDYYEHRPPCFFKVDTFKVEGNNIVWTGRAPEWDIKPILEAHNTQMSKTRAKLKETPTLSADIIALANQEPPP